MKLPFMIHGVCFGSPLVYYTEGLSKFGSLELELVLPVEPEKAQKWLNIVGSEIVDGRAYKSGERIEGMFTCPFYLLNCPPVFRSEGERVLRMVVPDEHYLYPWEDGCAEIFRQQLTNAGIMIARKQLLSGSLEGYYG